MKEISFDYYRDRMFPGFDKEYCKIVPHIVYDGRDTAFMFYTMLYLGGSDVFHDIYVTKSSDGGKTFGEPRVVKTVEYTENGIRTIWGFDSLHYHKKTGKYLCFGRTTQYANDKHPVMTNGVGHSDPYMVVFDPETQTFGELIPMPMPFATRTAVPHGQVIENEAGELYLTHYFVTPDTRRSDVMTVSYTFDGRELRLGRVGTPIVSGADHLRGYAEPSVAYLDGKYYLTLRTDEQGLLAISDDGYTFSEPKPWTWDDGSILENYNTQQRWVRFPDGLFLVYTRRGAHNDHVFRHRAPLFMARFDEDRMCLIRESEVILVPEMGARLGNFGVTDVSESEAWVSVAEWMQSNATNPDQWKTCMQYGSDNAIWRTRVVKK